MKFCSKCGRQLMDEAVICPACGCSQGTVSATSSGVNDASSAGYAFLGFCIPIVGLILYLIWKDQTPLRAKSAGKGALASVIVSVVLYVIYFVIIAALIGTGAMYY